MAFPVPVGGIPTTANTVFKLTFFTNGMNQGFSETVYINPLNLGTNLTALQACANFASQWGVIRQAGETADWSLQAVRIQDVTQGSAAKLFQDATWPKVGTYAVPVTGPIPTISEAPKVGILVDYFDGSSTVRRSQIWRGIPKAWNATIGSRPRAINLADALCGTFLGQMLGLLSSDANRITPILANCLLKYRVKDPAVNPPAVISAIGVNLAGQLNYTITSSAVPGSGPTTPIPPALLAGLVPGASIIIRGIRIRCLKKLNGRAIVQSVTQVSPPTSPPSYIIQTCKPYCCGPMTVSCPVAGTMRLNISAYTQIASATNRLIAEKKVGRPFFVTAGRVQAGFCC